MPEIVPSAATLIPGGSPAAADQVYGGVPPVADNICEYATPTVPFGNDCVATARPAATVIVKSAVLEDPAESVARAVKRNVPAVVGVPEIAPLELSDKPAGKVPPARDQVYGGVPPDAVRVWLYATPASAPARVVTLIVTPGATVMEKSFAVEAPAVSATRPVKVKIPAAAGVPLIAPAALNDRPAGSAPAATDQV